MKIEYNNLYTHFVFTTFGRQKTIPEINRERIKKYITGIVNKNQSKLYAIYANPEHVHFLVSRSALLSEEELATISSAFSVSKSDIDRVCRYILNQPEHHKKVSLEEEYEMFLKYCQDTLKNKVNKVGK